jgi:hypothetical protein
MQGQKPRVIFDVKRNRVSPLIQSPQKLKQPSQPNAGDIGHRRICCIFLWHLRTTNTLLHIGPQDAET